MGAWNSGRYGAKPTVEACGSIVLDVNAIMRRADGRGLFGVRQSGTLDGKPFEVSLIAEQNGWAGTLAIIHDEFEHLSATVPAQRYQISMVAEACRFGGKRWYLICPRTGRRVVKLCLPNGAHRFASREAYRLAYRSQRVGGLEVIHARMRRLYRKLGARYEYFDKIIPPRPKGMRWETYARIANQLRNAIADHNLVFVASAGPFPRRVGRMRAR
jgi:hypothetical protein